MDENNNAAVFSDSLDLLAVEDASPEMEQYTETVIAEVVDDRLFMTTPIDDYTVTEGLLLLIFLVLVLQFVIRFVKGAFWWL